MKKKLLAMGSAALLLTLTGCGDTSEASAETADSGDLREVTVGLIPVAEMFPVYIAEEQGFFEEAGLDVTVEVISNAASIVPSVMNGQIDIGTSATPPFLTAVEQDMPILAVANAANTSDDPQKDTGAFIVGADSDIESPVDLEGKTVAVNALSSLPHVAAAARISADGGDPDSVQFVSMPFNDMETALTQDRVDAILAVEPFMSQNLAAGGKEISSLYVDVYPPSTTHTLYFGSQQMFQTSPETLISFRDAVGRATELVADDPDILREALVEYGGMSEEVAQSVNLPIYQTEFNIDGINDMMNKMVENGFLEAELPVEELIMD